VGKKNTLQTLHGSELRGQECSDTLDEVGVDMGSKLNPVKVAINSTLGEDNLGCKVGMVEEPVYIKDGLEAKGRVVL
jgi:hypothetical protein